MKQAGVVKKNELHLTLASKKTQNKSAKKVLKTPNTNYKPILAENDETELKSIMENLFPPLKRIPLKISWSEIKGIPQNERKDYRSNKKESADSQIIENRKNIVSGINAVTRCLEKNLIRAIVIAKDIDPPFMVNHVINLCIISRVPILIMESLREVTRTMLGYSAIVIGFTTKLENDYFLPLINRINQMSSKKYPLPIVKDTIVKNITYKTKLKNISKDSGKNSMETIEIKDVEPMEESEDFIPLCSSASTSNVDTLNLYKPVKVGTMKKNPDRKKKNKKPRTS